jgi:ABC-type Fe3+-hydroxamate transport system substrate-binding protein
VSLVPSQTETLFALGAGERVVGVTEYCVHPADALAGVARVGGTKTPDLERIGALRPDLVLANREENRRLDVERLEAAGLRVFVTYARNVDDAVAEIALLGQLTGRTAEAARVCVEIAGARAALPERAPVRVVALIWKHPYMAVGPDCFASDLLRVCGGHNAVPAGRRRYPQLDARALAALAPEVILLPTEPYAFGAEDIPELLALDCPAARSRRVHVVEGELLTWYGPRIARAIETFGALLA